MDVAPVILMSGGAAKVMPRFRSLALNGRLMFRIGRHL
jgi:hypothetical protein